MKIPTIESELREGNAVASEKVRRCQGCDTFAICYRPKTTRSFAWMCALCADAIFRFSAIKVREAMLSAIDNYLASDDPEPEA